MKQSRKFILEQSAVLASLGYSEADIARTIKWVEKKMPADADEKTWVPTEADLRDDLLTDQAVQDAHRAWVQSRAVPRKYKSLLDAMVVD